MNAIEIVCESCESRMRLSDALVDRISGRTGRVTCKRCSNKVVLDARGEAVVVLSGGSLLAPPEMNLGDATQGDELRFSEMPPDDGQTPAFNVSVPPPLPLASMRPPLSEDLKRRRSMSRAARMSAASGIEPATAFGDHGEAGEFEAPMPPMRDKEDSLSPHAFHDEDDGDMVQLGREIKSSPFNSLRDETYRSLYPVTRLEVKSAPEHEIPTAPKLSSVPHPPRAGELHRASLPATDPFLDAVPGQASGEIYIGKDGLPHNLADRDSSVPLSVSSRAQLGSVPPSVEMSRTGNWMPWAVAAAACFALGMSLAAHPNGQKWAQEMIESQKPVVPALARLTQAATSELPAVEEPLPQPELIAFTTRAEEYSIMAEPVVVTEVSQPYARTSQETDVSGSRTEAKEQSKVAQTEPAEPAVTTPFSAAAASIALRNATSQASSCRTPGDPTGEAKVAVTFAPSGRVTSATVSGPPFAGTRTGGCIATQFRNARVPAFAGEHVTVSKTVTIR